LYLKSFHRTGLIRLHLLFDINIELRLQKNYFVFIIRNTSKPKAKAPVIRPSTEIAESGPIDHNSFSTHTLKRIIYQNSPYPVHHTLHPVDKKNFQSIPAVWENRRCLFWCIQNTLCGQDVKFYFKKPDIT